MISQLYQSRSASKKRFCNEGIHFGWKAIEDMFSREVGRIREGKRVRVPSLKPNFVFRDSWTMLNVRPAKIMQVSVQLTTVITVRYALHVHVIQGRMQDFRKGGS